MVKDKRYAIVGHLIQDGRIICFREMFDVIPKSIVAADLWMNNTRFDKLKNNTQLFRLKDLYRLAELLNVEEREVLMLALNQHLSDKEKRKKHGKK